MNYKKSDLKHIASILCGSKRMDVPEDIFLEESNIYEICYDLNIDADFLYRDNINVEKETENPLKGSRLGKAVTYATNQRKYMENYF